MVEAFSLLQKEEVGIILLDMMMPGIDSYDAIPFFKINRQIQAYTGNCSNSAGNARDKEKGLQVDADDYAAKPVNVEVLIKTLKQHLK